MTQFDDNSDATVRPSIVNFTLRTYTLEADKAQHEPSTCYEIHGAELCGSEPSNTGRAERVTAAICTAIAVHLFW